MPSSKTIGDFIKTDKFKTTKNGISFKELDWMNINESYEMSIFHSLHNMIIELKIDSMSKLNIKSRTFCRTVPEIVYDSEVMIVRFVPSKGFEYIFRQTQKTLNVLRIYAAFDRMCYCLHGFWCVFVYMYAFQSSRSHQFPYQLVLIYQFFVIVTWNLHMTKFQSILSID